MEKLVRDARFALRTLRKQPAFAVTAIATLALAIGASTAIFSVVEATILRPLPFQTSNRLAFLWGVAGPQRAIRGASFIEAQDWARLNRTFERVAIYDETSLNLRGDAGGERVEAEMVSASYFPMLGATAAIGRTFTAAEDSTPNTHAVVTISHRMWTTRFGSDPAVIGKSLTLNDRPFTIVGVMRPEFAGLSFDTDVWFPAMMVQANGGPSNLASRGDRWLGAVGRLKPGVTLERAQADMDRVAGQLAQEFPQSNSDRGVQLFSLRESYLGSTENLLWSVFAAVGLLLLIACANVLGLQIVRAASRSREIALRLAIGADRWRLVQQLVVEGLVLSAVAAGFGILVAYWGLQGLLALAPDGTLPNYAVPTINGWTFAFAFAVTIFCGVLFGLIPALRASRVDLVDSLKEGARGSSVGFGRRIGGQQLLVVGETALALVMLIGAGLFVRSLQRQLAVDPGFSATDVLRARVVLPQEYTPERRLQVAQQISERLRAIPSVTGVAIGSDLPLSGSSSAAMLHLPQADQRVRYYRHLVLPGFVETMGIRVIDGRALGPDDRDGTPPVVMVNESMARRFWAGESAVGKRLRLGDANGPEVTVAGVVADVRYRDLTTPLSTSEPDVYFPIAQRPAGALQIGVRSTLPEESLTGAIRRELSGIDPALALFGVRPLEAIVAQQTANGRFASSVLGVFGAAALILTAVGLYGVLAFLVSLRSREIGIRLALGATRRAVLGEIVRHGLRLILIGITVGVVVALGVTRWIATLLFGIGAHDPAVFVAVPALLLAVAAVASWFPARRAALVDPQVTLRAD
jgi:putative ABC transport system permease protein